MGACLHALQDDGLPLVAQCLPRDDVLETCHCHNVPCTSYCDVLPTVGMHKEEAGDALALAFVRVESVCALGQLSTAIPKHKALHNRP